MPQSFNANHNFKGSNGNHNVSVFVVDESNCYSYTETIHMLFAWAKFHFACVARITLRYKNTYNISTKYIRKAELREPCFCYIYEVRAKITSIMKRADCVRCGMAVLRFTTNAHTFAYDKNH